MPRILFGALPKLPWTATVSSKCSEALCLTLCSETSLVAELNTVVSPSHSWSNLPGFACQLLSASMWHRRSFAGLNGKKIDHAECLPSSLVPTYCPQDPCWSHLCVASHIKGHIVPYNLINRIKKHPCVIALWIQAELYLHLGWISVYTRVLYMVWKTGLWDLS